MYGSTKMVGKWKKLKVPFRRIRGGWVGRGGRGTSKREGQQTNDGEFGSDDKTGGGRGIYIDIIVCG